MVFLVMAAGLVAVGLTIQYMYPTMVLLVEHSINFARAALEPK